MLKLAVLTMLACSASFAQVGCICVGGSSAMPPCNYGGVLVCNWNQKKPAPKKVVHHVKRKKAPVQTASIGQCAIKGADGSFINVDCSR